jgi:hypothetical protein
LPAEETLSLDLEAPPPASARQPRDELRPLDPPLHGLDDGLPGLDEEEEPPASGEVESQRIPTPLKDETGLDVQLLVPGAAPPVEGSLAGTVSVGPDVIEAPRFQGDVATFLGAIRSPRPLTFGELLDATLALGE